MVKLILLWTVYAVITAICFIRIKQINEATTFKDFIKIVSYLLIFLLTSILVIQNL